jgi:hypothetical protein
MFLKYLKLLGMLGFVSACTTKHVMQEIAEVEVGVKQTACLKKESFPDRIKGPSYFDLQDGCIHVDLDRMLIVYNQWGTDAVAGLWLHELYHAKQYYNGGFCDVSSHVDMKRKELAADYSAGCGLARLGRSDYKLRKYLAEYYIPSSTHGTLPQRIKAVSRGFESCSK